MSASKIDATKYTNVASNTVFDAVLDAATILAWRENVMTTVNQHATEIDSKPTETTADVTYYVATTGNDSNNGTAVGTPFLTFAKAVSMIPQIVNHNIIINVASGTYAEAVGLQGYSGKGSIQILGGVSSVDAANFHIKNLTISQNGIRVFIRGLDLTDATVISINVDGCRRVELEYILSTAAATSKYGLFSSFSTVAIDNSTISNRFVSMSSQNGSTIYSNSNGGSGSTVGLESTSASKIGKNGTQPAGTTAETTSGGGTIS